MKELNWIIDGIEDVIIGVILSYILMVIGVFISSSLYKLLGWFLNVLGLLYLIYVSEKETWIYKELFIGFGMIIAGLFIDPLSALIGILASLIVVYRLYFE